MSTMILRQTHQALIEEMERLEKKKKETSIKIREGQQAMVTLKKMQNIMLQGKNKV